MKRCFSTCKSAIAVLIIFISVSTQAQTINPPSKKQARQWTEQREWANGFKPMPHKTTDYQEFYTQYHKNKELWDKAFTWMSTHDLIAIPAGKYEIEGKRCYVSVENGTTQDASKRKIESHRQYIDLQYVAKGTERFGIIAMKDAKPITGYKPDVIHYESNKIKYVDSNPDIFFMFFPQNCHQAMVKAGKESEAVRVIVVKIEYLP